MGKAGKWFRSILKGKKDDEKRRSHVSCYSVASESPGTPLSATPKEKRRWSFRRSSPETVPPKDQITFEAENEQKRHVLAADVAAAVICLTSTNNKASLVQEAAAIRIQSYFRSYLAKKALCALRGLVKLQALVRGHLVRKQAFATLRCMQALITAQDRARALMIQMGEDQKSCNQRPSVHRKSTQDNQSQPGYHAIDRSMEETIKIVEMDMGEPNRSLQSRNNHSNQSQTGGANHKFSMQNACKSNESCNLSPVPACIGNFEDSSFDTAQTSPLYYSAVSKPDHSRVPFAFSRLEYAESLSYDDPLFPNYMANTVSSRAKVRSQNAPKSRPDSFERQPNGRKQSIDGRNVRMQRSASQVSSTAQNYQYLWSIKLDKSTVYVKDSECGSTYSVLTTSNYHRSPIANEATEIIHYK